MKRINYISVALIVLFALVEGCGPLASETATPAPTTPSPLHPYWYRLFDYDKKVYTLLKDGNWLWVGLDYGVVRIDLQTLERTLWVYTGTYPDMSLGRVCAMTQDPQGCIWVAGVWGVARHCDSASGESLGWQPVFPGQYVYSMGFDAEGNLWTVTAVGRGSSIIARYDGHEPPQEGDWPAERLAPADILSDDCENWFARDWRGADSRNHFGSVQKCRQLAAWQQYLGTLPAGLELEQPVPPLAVDADGVWLFAIRTHPSSYWPARYFLLRFTGAENEPLIIDWPSAELVAVTRLVADEKRGSVWIGTLDGLFFSDGQAVYQMSFDTGNLVPVGPAVHDLVRDAADRLWAVTDLGPLYYDQEADRWQSTEIDERVLITADEQGGVWVLPLDVDGYVSHFDGER